MLEVQISMLEISKRAARMNDSVNVSIKMLWFYHGVVRHQHAVHPATTYTWLVLWVFLLVIPCTCFLMKTRWCENISPCFGEFCLSTSCAHWDYVIGSMYRETRGHLDKLVLLKLIGLGHQHFLSLKSSRSSKILLANLLHSVLFPLKELLFSCSSFPILGSFNSYCVFPILHQK